MAVKYENLFNSIKPLCGGYIEATHLLPYMSFIRHKAGSIRKAHKRSLEEGFQVMYDALLQSDTEDKWDLYYKALNETEFNSICKLYKFMQEQTNDFDYYCNIFRIFSNEITEGQLDFIEFANALKSMETIEALELDNIQQIAKTEGINSATILLFACFPSTLSFLMKDLVKCLNSLHKTDLLKRIQEAVPLYKDEENCTSNERGKMILHLYDDIVNTVHPRDIWNKLAIDLGGPVVSSLSTSHMVPGSVPLRGTLELPVNSIDYTERRDIVKVMDKFNASTYQGRFQSLYEALVEAGYEQLCLKIDSKKCAYEENKYYQSLLATQQSVLSEKIKTSEISNYLLNAKVINKRDKDEIDALRDSKGDTIAAQCLLEVVPLKKDLWFKDFFEILRKNKQKKLVKMIDSEYSFSSDTEDDTDSDTNLDTNHEDSQPQIKKERTQAVKTKAKVRTKAEEIVLRDYQKELISKALLGKNCIICAPTGSGKTIMAVKIIEDHLKQNGGKDCKVIFLCNQTALADQQCEVLTYAFPDFTITVIYGSPESQSKKMESFSLSDIVVMTPQCLVDNLKLGRIKSVSIITLLIIDECHHTYGKHPYNILMSRYLDEKFDNPSCQLPKVIGLTAVAGDDTPKTGKNAKEHFMEICANLDCEELCITKNEMDNLREHVPVPMELTKSTSMENESALSEVIKSFMRDVHTSLNDREFNASCLQFGTTYYVGWLSDAKKQVNSSPIDLKHEFASVNILDICNKALLILKGYRVKDAIRKLRDYLENETLDTDAFKNLKILLEHKLLEFEERSTPEELEVESPCLVELVRLIQENFHDKPDSRIIVFVETKSSTRILAKVLHEKTETTNFNPRYLMAGINTDSGPGMSMNKQKEILELFRSGKCKLLIATPVAEEGLDIQKCNLVIDYLTVQGVRSHVQKRGRARAVDGKYIQIIGSDPILGKRAFVNRSKVDKMQTVVNRIYEDQLKNPVAFKETLKEIQWENKQERDTAKIQKTMSVNTNTSGTYTLKCTSCNCVAAKSSDFRHFEEKCYVIVNPNFRKIIDISRSREPSILFDDIKRISSFYCKSCNLFWGNQLVYKHTIFDCITIKNFKIVPEGKDPILAKKWSKVPFRNTIQSLTEEDFEMVRNDRDNNYDEDLQVAPEKFPIPESNPDVVESESDE